MADVIFYSKSKGDNKRLSNFAPLSVPINLNGIDMDSGEKYFQASKVFIASDGEYKSKLISQIAAADTPAKAKTLGGKKSFKTFNLILDANKWQTESLIAQHVIIQHRLKTDPDFVDILERTGDRKLVHFERATRHNVPYWGACTVKGQDGIYRGQNMLGEMLMRARATLVGIDIHE